MLLKFIEKKEKAEKRVNNGDRKLGVTIGYNLLSWL